ncbi:hypothetical protein GCM10022410_20500 [Amphibacillus indicireducens]|uniref:Transposase DDE domain-containing protein n=1 Tax=Amphibacillus indicireducens TaxID=1076330 RepID=A0ABP7VWR4_9BACI
MTFPVLEGKVAIVTGAAMGMGEEIAKLFAEAKAKVIVADINEEKGQAVVDAIKADGGEAAFVKTDVSSSEDVQNMVKFAVDTYGKLDVAVNNAALTPDDKPAAEFDEDYWDRLMAIDLKGAALCQKYDDILNNRKRVPLITYNLYRKEKKKKFREDPFNTANWTYHSDTNSYVCPNEKQLNYLYESTRTDRYGFKRTFKVYECEDCTGCPLRELCTKAKEGTNRRLYQNAKWESQKEYVREKLSDKKTGEIYRKRKIDVEPFFGFLKANLGFTRLSLRGQSKAHNELGFALLAVNLRKFTANNVKTPMNPNDDKNKNGSIYDKTVSRTIFYLVRLVMSQPRLKFNLS